MFEDGMCCRGCLICRVSTIAMCRTLVNLVVAYWLCSNAHHLRAIVVVERVRRLTSVDGVTAAAIICRSIGRLNVDCVASKCVSLSGSRIVCVERLVAGYSSPASWLHV